jgi:hypothetical protein
MDNDTSLIWHTDVTKEAEATVLKNWCKETWEKVLKQAYDSGNKITFFPCCLSFCTRRFADKSDHSEEEKKTLADLLKPYKAKDGNSFYMICRTILEERMKNNMPSPFPTLDIFHSTQNIELVKSFHRKVVEVAQLQAYVHQLERELKIEKSIKEDLAIVNLGLKKKIKKLYQEGHHTNDISSEKIDSLGGTVIEEHAFTGGVQNHFIKSAFRLACTHE